MQVAAITKNDQWELFDPTSNDIILISYPTGGFGNFIYHVLTEFADQTIKINNDHFNFSDLGNSHSTAQYTDSFWHEPDDYVPKIQKGLDIHNKKILVRHDPGWELSAGPIYEKTNKIFPNATIIRTVVNDDIIGFLIYEIGLTKTTDKKIFVDIDNFIANWDQPKEDYAWREFYTLSYKELKSNKIFLNLTGWSAINEQRMVNLSLKDLINDPYNCLVNLIKTLGMTVIKQDSLRDLCAVWLEKHSAYFYRYKLWDTIRECIESEKNLDISHITDLQTQGYINYCVEEKFNIVIPPYDYKNWFQSTNEIKKMIGKISFAD